MPKEWGKCISIPGSLHVCIKVWELVFYIYEVDFYP